MFDMKLVCLDQGIFSADRFESLFIAGLSLGLLGMYLVLFLINRYLRRMSLSHSCQTAFVSSFPDIREQSRVELGFAPTRAEAM
jgi:hypothetical protein